MALSTVLANIQDSSLAATVAAVETSATMKGINAAYAEAKANGDKAAMQTLHEAAEEFRAAAGGYTSGTYGDKPTFINSGANNSAVSNTITETKPETNIAQVVETVSAGSNTDTFNPGSYLPNAAGSASDSDFGYNIIGYGILFLGAVVILDRILG